MGYIIGIIFILLVFSNDSARVVTATNYLATTDIIAVLDAHAKVLIKGDGWDYLQGFDYVDQFTPKHKENLNQALNQIKTLPPKYQEILINIITGIKTNDILNQIEATTKLRSSVDDAMTTFTLQKEIVLNQVEHMTNIPIPAAKTGIMKYGVTILATTIVTGFIVISFLYN